MMLMLFDGRYGANHPRHSLLQVKEEQYRPEEGKVKIAQIPNLNDQVR